MKHWIAAAASVGIAIGALSAQAAEKKVEDITCEEFLAMKPENQNRIAYWVAGFAAGTSQDVVHEVAFDKFGQPIGELVTDCEATPKETLWQKVKKYLS
ncbi:MAG TPA: HdeA/HdeB family chaperone [Myxococcota bacterium]|nr:HdeA/HdeB family chaperone [Myxococcota bacterium]